MHSGLLLAAHIVRGIHAYDKSKLRILAAQMSSVSRQPGLFATFEEAMPPAVQLAHSNLLPSAACDQIDLS